MKKIVTIIISIVVIVAILVGGFLLLNHFVFNSQEKQLIGAWENETGTGGYEFLEDGIVKVTALKLSVPIFGSEVAGSYEGTYTVEKDEISLAYQGKIVSSIEVKKKYKFEIKDDILYLTDMDKENQEATKYVRVDK